MAVFFCFVGLVVFADVVVVVIAVVVVVIVTVIDKWVRWATLKSRNVSKGPVSWVIFGLAAGQQVD